MPRAQCPGNTPAILDELGAGEAVDGSGEALESIDPASRTFARTDTRSPRPDYDARSTRPCIAFESWRTRPRRGAARWSARSASAARAQAGARRSGHARDRQDPREGEGEVQEMIDICRLRGRPVAPALRPDDALASGRGTACTSSGIRSGWSASSPPSTSRSRSGRWNADDRRRLRRHDASGSPRRETPLCRARRPEDRASGSLERTGCPGVFTLFIGRGAMIGERMPTIAACR